MALAFDRFGGIAQYAIFRSAGCASVWPCVPHLVPPLVPRCRSIRRRGNAMTARPAQSCNQAPTRFAVAAFIAAAGIAAAGMMLPTAAQAQMPPDIAAKIAAL